MRSIITLPSCILDRLATDRLVVGKSTADSGLYVAAIVTENPADSIYITGPTPEDAIGNLEQLLWDKSWDKSK